MLSTFGAASSRAFGHTSGGALAFTSSQVFCSGSSAASFSGTYTPTAGTKAALFMVFGAIGPQSSSSNSYYSGMGGGAYAERYVDNLDASYAVSLYSGSSSYLASMIVNVSPINSTTGASINSGSAHDFAAAGGNGGSGYSSSGGTWGYGGGGGGRCGTGGQGPNSYFQGYDPTGGAPVPNSGNEAAGVFDLSPFGISFTYDRYSSQVPKFDTASTATEIALRDNLNTAALFSRNGGLRGALNYTSGVSGSAVIIEFS